jgi:hypothetical protein
MDDLRISDLEIAGYWDVRFHTEGAERRRDKGIGYWELGIRSWGLEVEHFGSCMALFLLLIGILPLPDCPYLLLTTHHSPLIGTWPNGETDYTSSWP